MSLQASAREAECGNIDNINAVRADNPKVKVPAIYPELPFKSPRPELPFKPPRPEFSFKSPPPENAFRPPHTQGCAAVTFTLSIKPHSNGELLIPQNVKIYNASETRFGFAAVKAVSQWEYSAKDIQSSALYFTIIRFL